MIARALDLPPERVGRAASTELGNRRRALALAIAQGSWRTDPLPQEITIGNVRLLQFDPPSTPQGLLIHFHGGAYRIGAPEAVAPFAAALAERSAVRILCPAYRLAPEHPFPAALIDGMTVINGLDDAHELPLLLSGDSAGGGLAAGLAALAISQHCRISGLVLLSAWLDLTVTSESFTTNAATDPLFSSKAASEAAELYLQGVSARHPLASPLFASVADFPPTLMNVGAGEVLAEDSRQLHAKLTAAGIEARLSMIPSMEHVAVTRSLALPGAADTFAAIARFIDARLASEL
jgi:monoterpene epsilon-lactone hydrolase